MEVIYFFQLRLYDIELFLQVNTFQVVIASDGLDSYVEFLYADGGIQWIQGIGQSSGLPDARAQAGLVSGDGRLYTLRGSGTDQIQNLDKYGIFHKNEHKTSYMRCQVLMAVSIKNMAFWNVMPCSLVDQGSRFLRSISNHL
jgi:hypothetical protein